MSGTRRRSYDAGHRPKFLVIVDDSAEFDRALYLAARRAARIGAGLVILAVIEPVDFNQWLGVGDIMRQEAEENAAALLEKAADRARAIAGIEAERVARTGQKAETIIALINEDEDILTLMLAAGTSAEGPGPLVSLLAGKAAGTFPIPVLIVPGDLRDEEIDALG